MGASATAQPRAVPCEAGTRRIELKTEPTRELPELCIGPGVSITLLFYGAELLGNGVTVEGRERFALVDPGSTTLRLVPSERVSPGERFRLTVRFRDGAAPASTAFWLVVSPGQVEPLVEVYRERRTLESYQQEVKEKDTQFRQCQEDTARLLAERESPGGLAGLFATEFMDEKGISPKDVTLSIVKHPGNFVDVKKVYSYRSTRTVAVMLWLWAPRRMQPWQAVRAELVGPGHRTLRVRPPWQHEPLRYNVEGMRMVIEADATEEETRGSFTLKVGNEDGTRSITLSGVTFP